MLSTILLSVLLSIVMQGTADPLWNKYQKYLELEAVDLFREYIRIDTSKEENIKYAVEFWIRQAKQLGLPYAVYEPAGKPIFVATLEGSDPSLPSIMLNSHMDVVKADENEWAYPPFSAYMDENGDIYGRGSQDTKDVAIQYLEAIKKFKKENITLSRNLHITLMPDEEVGGENGIKAFVKTKEFKDLNIGFALDEGLASRDETLLATYVDRRPWQMEFVVYGEGGHGFTMPDNSAMEKAQRLINTIMTYRDTQKKIMKSKKVTDYGSYTSINVNMMNGGLAPNIVPSEMTLVADMRLSVDADAKEVQRMVNSWMDEAGNNTKISYIRHENKSEITPVDASNPYWVTMKNTLNSMGIKITPVVCPATSDMLVLRNLGIPALGFTTKTNTISRLHKKDEYQNVETFLKGIDIYYEVIKQLGNMPSEAAHIQKNILAAK